MKEYLVSAFTKSNLDMTITSFLIKSHSRIKTSDILKVFAQIKQQEPDKYRDSVLVQIISICDVSDIKQDTQKGFFNCEEEFVEIEKEII